MKRFLSLTLSALLIGGWLISATGAHAQASASLSAQVDRTELSTDDTLLLTLTLQTPDGSAPHLTLPAIDGFRALGSSMSTQLSSINGTTSASVTYVYRLQPTVAGTFTIPALTLDWNGQPLSTEAIKITVTQGAGAAPQAAPQISAPQITPSASTPLRPAAKSAAQAATISSSKRASIKRRRTRAKR